MVQTPAARSAPSASPAARALAHASARADASFNFRVSIYNSRASRQFVTNRHRRRWLQRFHLRFRRPSARFPPARFARTSPPLLFQELLRFADYIVIVLMFSFIVNVFLYGLVSFLLFHCIVVFHCYCFIVIVVIVFVIAS